MMSEHKHVLSQSAQRSTKPNQQVDTTPPQTSEIETLQHVIGNYAVQRLLAQGNPIIAPRIQPKLHVGAADDRYEHEADSVANAVMNMSDVSVQRAQEEDELQAKRVDIQRAAEDDELMAKRVDMMGEFDVGGSVEQGIQQTAGGGQPLADSARDFLEPRFGHQFDNVHVHADSSADSLNRSIQARAFTKGSDIYFASGEYKPDSSAGRELLAHELTHVIQQTGGSPTRK
jgi:hypothetical protein